jgi:hypothetical protein
LINLLSALNRIAKENKALHPLLFSADMRQRTHGMHNIRQKLHCPIPTCERHDGEGFQRGEQLKRKGRPMQTGMRALRISSVLEMTQEALAY